MKVTILKLIASAVKVIILIAELLRVLS